jgi:hypothetical protein
MKSFDQLAQAAYEASRKRAIQLGIRATDESPAWDKLSQDCQECWIAATKQLWAEFAAMH